ncbi:MAG: response regulator [Archangium sp.]|nr:response regulator [Archangium sp.]MDP3153532.1 response regulator [Archangium sp.]MDP3574544.1 response regulator [Archangium sp.]
MSAVHQFGKYEFITLLSVGGMAEVHLACINGPGGFRKFVVVKRILPDLQDDPHFAAMFATEAHVTASLSHSNIAQVYEFGSIDEQLFLSMEFIHGIDLVKAMKRCQKEGRKVPRGLALRVIRDVSRALHYAHTFVDPSGTPRPVIHRDVTPRNIMLSHSGTVKIIDFGIAKVAGSGEQTSVGSVKGSAGYMAPEQVLGEPLDARCDVFSVGIILHELLTGQRLFAASEPKGAMRRVVLETPPTPISLVPELPPALSALTMKALERKREDRFATARDLAAAIEAAAGAELFDEYAIGAWVCEQFPEQLARTRNLLESLDRREDSAVRAIAGSIANDVDPQTGRSQSAPASSVDATIAFDASRGATVLVVDDSSLGQKLVSHRLEAEGFRVVVCSSAEEALATLAEMKPDLIVSDVRMGGLDGFELCARVRQQPELHNLPFIFLSASCLPEERVQGMAVGGDDFIRKPFEPADLLARVRAHLHRVAVLRRSAP